MKDQHYKAQSMMPPMAIPTRMRYEVVTESVCGCYETTRIQTGSLDTANRELFAKLEPGHEWKVTMFIEGEPAAWRFEKP